MDMLLVGVGVVVALALIVPSWPLSTAVLFVGLGVLYREHLKRRITYFASIGIPTPPVQSLFLGHLPELCKGNQHHEHLVQWERQYGKTFGLYEGAHRVLVSSDIAVAQEVFVKQFPAFHSRYVAPWFAIEQRNNEFANLFVAEGNQWKRLRALVSSTLTVSKIKAMDPILNTVFSELGDCIETANQKGRGEVDLKPLLVQAGFVFIGRSAVGIYEPIGMSALLKDFLRLFEGGDELKMWRNRFFAGTYDFFPVTKWLALANFLLDSKGMIVLRNKAESVIRARENESATEKAARNPDFIDFLRESQGASDDIDDGEKQLFDTKVVKKLTREELIACGVLFLMAGTDTTANTTSLTMYELAKRPEWQQIVLEEINDCLEDREPNYNDLCKMSALDRFVREVNRCYPVAGGAMRRRAVQDTTITDSQGHSIRVEKGTCVHVNVYAMHLDTELWGPDAACFDPDRFLEPNVRNSAAFLAFGAGLRMCPGMKLALHEVKLTVVHLLRRFRFELSSTSRLHLQHRTILGPDQVLLKVTNRT